MADKRRQGERELARIRATGPRRVIGLGFVFALGAVLLYIAAVAPPAALGWLAFLLILGGLVLWTGWAMLVATRSQIVLTETRLYDTARGEIARLEDVERVTRGPFAIKPSNGFTLVLRASGARAWAPGMWWRLGRRVAIGGVTNARETRPVADIIAFKLAERDAQG